MARLALVLVLAVAGCASAPRCPYWHYRPEPVRDSTGVVTTRLVVHCTAVRPVRG